MPNTSVRALECNWGSFNEREINQYRFCIIFIFSGNMLTRTFNFNTARSWRFQQCLGGIIRKVPWFLYSPNLAITGYLTLLYEKANSK